MLNEVLILLFFSVVSLAIFKRLNFPSVLGYLVVGMLAGEHAFGWIHASHALEQIAEIGVVFLLFTIGLEVSIPRLVAMRGIVFGIGTVQVVVSTVSTLIIMVWLGLPWQVGLVVGGALTMSSTAIVVKQLTEQYELHTRHGNIALGVLLFQDLAVVPFLVMIPILANPGNESLLGPLSIALAKGAAAFVVIFLFGQYLLRPAIRAVASTRSNELFTLFILLTALLAAWLTWQLGLSLAMGAFLAGIMLAETEYQHHVESEIRPFRDVLLGLFFISVGSQFDWRVIFDQPMAVAILTVGLIAGKGIAIMIITRLAGFEKAVAVRCGIILGQGSEFGFAVLAIALATGLLDITVSQPIIAAIIFSMAVSPFLIRNNQILTGRLYESPTPQNFSSEENIEELAGKIDQHVIICGFGRTGQNLARFLHRIDVPFIALETDTLIVTETWEAGEPVFYGDAAKRSILQHAGISRASVLVISFPDSKASERILQTARELSPDIPVIVRIRDDSNLEHMLDCGATEVVPDTVESSIMLARHALRLLGQSRKKVDRLLTEARESNYAQVRSFFHPENDLQMESSSKHHLLSVEILPTYKGVNRSIDSFKRLKNVRTVALRRDGERSDDPPGDTVLQENDVLIIEGTPDDMRAAEIEIMSGL